MDSGIDENHPHFARHQNLALPEQLEHLDFTALDPKKGRPLVDEYGHGTHVAGIIAGALAKVDGKLELEAEVHIRNEQDQTESKKIPLEAISGVAPECKLMSIKVLDQNGEGLVSNLITALEAIQEMNGYGKVIRVHGVNLSLGYEFNPEWFACGQSPLCSEVNRLVRSGVVVVAAAGNTGYGLALNRDGQTTFPTGLGLTINDPGNADLAITVGSTHRELPHTYGISYFSSKGPTGDGRDKPDLVAPGEKIISCASSWQPTEAEPGDPAETPAVVAHAATAGEATAAAAAPAPAVVTARYREDSGTSMAAPHVSGVIAGFLSARREFIGQPERVKEIFLSSATDLKRNRYFQGHGLVDLLRAIQSV
jgi:subtilisin family serine protease